MNNLKTLLIGIWIGGTMSVPGVSGGTMAIIAGIYDKLISAVNSFFKFKKENLFFLMSFSLGGLIGLILIANLITYILNQPFYGDLLKLFFVGIVLGGIPLILKESNIKKLSFSTFFFPILGFIIAYIFSILPNNIFTLNEDFNIYYFLVQILSGFIISIALVLPGISASQMLLILGIYKSIMINISRLNLIPLLPICLSTILGILLSSNIIEKMLKNYTQKTYLLILGFIVASLKELLPEKINFFSPLTILTAFIGFLIMYIFSKHFH